MQQFKTLFCLLFFYSYSYSQSEADLFISARTKGILQEGYGMIITLMHLDSKTEYKSKALGLFSSHSYIDNIPSGRYIVTQIEVPLGSSVYINTSAELTAYFDTLTISSGSVNYLGNFYGVREIGLRNVFHLSNKATEIPPKLFKKATRKGLIDSQTKWIKHYPYRKSAITIY